MRGIAGVGPGAVVGTYVNDTPLGSSSNYARSVEFALDLMPYDVERMEVLRGPQGTLYGAGTMGGLLKYVLKDADPTAFKAQAGVEGLSIDGAGGSIGWGARGASTCRSAKRLRYASVPTSRRRPATSAMPMPAVTERQRSGPVRRPRSFSVAGL